jgi:hypothetical protein
MVDGFVSAAALAKLTLADSVWRLRHFTLDDLGMEHLWERQRGRCDEQALKLSTLAHLIANALLDPHGVRRRRALDNAD